MIEAICLARDLITTPSSDMGPAELADAIQKDILFLQDVSLPRLAEKPVERLRQRYAAFDHDAAREIVAWLDGAYKFEEEIA